MNEAIRWQLINATLNGDGQRLRSLLSKRIRIDLGQACQLFHLAAACGSTDNLKALLAFMPSINMNSRDEVGCTALHKAASAGHREAIHFLIYHGAQIDVQEYLYGNSPLHEVASKGFSRSVEALCISRAPPNLQNKLGLTPLHVAAQNGHKQSIRVLLFSGADLGVTDKFGNTCLHTAVRYSRTGVVKILLAASANVTATNQNLETPLHIAASLKRTKIARCLLAANSGREPISITSTLTRMSGGGLQKRTPSLLPLSSQSPPSAAQAALWMRNAQGETPLEVAKRRVRGSSGGGSSDMIALLLDRMNMTACSSHYENGTTKPFSRPPPGGDGGVGKSEHDTPLATPYMSTDVIYTPVQKKAVFRFAFMNRKLPKNPTTVEPNCSTFLNRQIHQEFKPSNVDQTTSVTPTLHQPQISEIGKVPTSCMNDTAAQNPAYLSSGLKTKSRPFRRPLLRGLFKMEHDKIGLPVLTGVMKKSESSQLPASGVPKFAVNNETPLLKMSTSISVSGALNESHSSSFTGGSVLQDVSLLTDDPLQDSLLLGRFQQLPLPQNSESTSAGVSGVHLPEDATTTNNSGDHDPIPSHSAPAPRSNPDACVPLSGFVNGNSGGGGNVGVGGSGERTRPRLGVRFDLDAGGDVHTAPAPVAHGRQLSMQLYRDLAGNLKKGPAGSSSGCNCIQRQADYFAGKVPDFVPCASHSYLEFHASTTDPRNSNLPRTRKSRPDRGGTTTITTAAGRNQRIRSHSDESLSVGGCVKGEPLTNATPPTKPATMKKNLPSADPLPGTCMWSSNGRPVSANYEDVAGWPLSGHQVQPTLNNGEMSQESASQQKISKSKSYSEQMASVVDATATQATNGGLINTKMARRVAKATPLYMSCRNIGGKMGFSVGRFSPTLPTLMPTNGASAYIEGFVQSERLSTPPKFNSS
ncbi:Ankyrin repeat domain-containing protein 6 [Echinococcus granulosus]|nr:Ankyrin repeat domain-containing protein 6 [Echinococcus granulosus]